MAEIFVSYARKDEPIAERVAASLRTSGYTVWRDDELPAHRAYADVIEERLKGASAVIVLWSAEAAASQWVRAEADAARIAGTLVQASIDGCVPPMPFNQIQCADLKDWDGNAAASGWRKLAASIAALVGDRETLSVGNVESKQRKGASICVLPFANMSGDTEQEYFSDGISEDITTDLSKVSALSVTARNTAFTFKNNAVDVADIARRLEVSHVLEGSVRKAGDRVRITAQLIDGATGDHVWAERYDRDLTDIFAIQDEISKAIVDALKLKLLPEEKKAIESRGTSDPEAYNLYLMARQIWVTGNYGDTRRDAIVARTVERAISIDAGYAQAWALLALAQASLRYHHGQQGDDGLAAATRALDLDPTIVAAYCVRARHFAEQDDFTRANAEIAQGLALDPNSWDVRREAGRLCMAQRRIVEAMQHYERSAALDDTDYHSPMMLVTCYSAQGLVDEKRNAAQIMTVRADRVIAQDPLNAAALGVSAGGMGILGDIDGAKERFQRAMVIDPDNVNMPYNFACMLASWLGDKDGAIELIEPLFKRVSRGLLLTALADPDLDCLRDDPRFQGFAAAAMKRTGVTEDMIPSGSTGAEGPPA